MNSVTVANMLQQNLFYVWVFLLCVCDKKKSVQHGLRTQTQAILLQVDSRLAILLQILMDIMQPGNYGHMTLYAPFVPLSAT